MSAPKETGTAPTYHAQQCYHEGCQWHEKDAEIQRLRQEVVLLNQRLYRLRVAIEDAYET